MMFEGLPAEVRSLVRPDGSVVVPSSMVPWLEAQLRAQLLRGHGNPKASAVTFLKALVVGADVVESSANGTSVFEVGRIGVRGDSKPFLTAAQAAELTERTERGIRKACELGRLPAEKFGSVWRIDPKDLDKYVHGKGAGRGQDG